MEANSHNRGTGDSCSLRNRNRRSPGGPQVRPPQLPAACLQPLALSLIFTIWWPVLQVQPAWGQVIRGTVPPVPDVIDAYDTAEDGGNVVSSDGVDDILSLADEPLDSLTRQNVVVAVMDVEVSTVARQQGTVGRSPAAVFVITSEMIRRSGATCVPELLRMVPGLEVGRSDSHTWVVSSRGFSERYANKLLVLIDGRSVYTPLFSGVYWDTQDVLLEDVARIEVIRGPGGTLWGANAVNGVINIITKTAEDTQGVLLTTGGGSHDRTVNGARYGGQNGQGLAWRVYGKQFERGPGFSPFGTRDNWRMTRAGFRADWEPDSCRGNSLTVQGDCYEGKEGSGMLDVDPASPSFLGPVFSDEQVSGANVLARWKHVYDEQSDWALQMYYDRAFRDQPILRQELSTFDVDFQHRFPMGSRHGIIWGLDFRQVHDDLSFHRATVAITPQTRTTSLFSAFVQDEIALVIDRLAFTVGTKLEHNDYTGFEYQPSARLLWTPDRRHSLWGAVSRAVRVPSRFEQDGYITLEPRLINPAPVYLFPRYTGNRGVTAEDLLAYEIGCRAQVTERFSYDATAFYSVYDNLVAFDAGTIYPEGANFIVPLDLSNSMTGETYGVELSAEWAVTEWWRLSPAYSFLQIQLHNPTRRTVEQSEGNSAHNRVHLRSYWDLPRDWEFDLALRYIDNLPNQDVRHYITMDIRLAWLPCENLEFAVVGRNMLDRYHPECGQDTFSFGTSEVRREIFAKATWRH